MRIVLGSVPADAATVGEFRETDDGLFSYGPPGTLQPIPGCQIEQPGDVLEHVPDTTLDWLDVDGSKIRAVSVRGHAHRYFGEVRQDSYAFHLYPDYVAMAVADGVGSSSASHLGSAIAARRTVLDSSLLERLLAVERCPTAETLDTLSEVLSYEAVKRRLEPFQLATTLMVAVIPIEPDDEGTFDVSLLRIGDSSAWRRTERSWAVCGTSDDSQGPETTATSALPMQSEATVWRESFKVGDVLALATDGVGNIVLNNDMFARELSMLWNANAPVLANLLKVLDATVKTYDDDRTFIGYLFS